MNVAMSSLLFTDKPLEESLRFIADHGFKYVDVGALQGWCHIQPQEVAEHPEKQIHRVMELLDSLGLEAVALNAGVTSIEQWEALVRLARHLGTPHITLPASGKGTALEKEAARLRPMIELASSHDVMLNVETHIGTMTENPEDALQLVQAVPGLGLTLDISHYYCNALEKEAEALLPYVRHVHMRDCGRSAEQLQMAYGEGLVDFPYWFNLLHSHGYHGDISIEYIDLSGVDFDHVQSALSLAKETKTFWEGLSNE